MRISIVIPVFNERHRIGVTLQKIASYFSSRPDFNHEIIVVNDGSCDDTASIVDGISKTVANISLINLGKNMGKGAAVKAGMLAAKGEYKFFMDADGSTAIEEIEKLLPFVFQGFRIVIGSRGVAGATIKKNQPCVRLVLGRIFRAIVNAILPVGVVDSQNGFKLFAAETANILFRKLNTTGWAFDVEILALARISGFRVKEVPVIWTNDDDSKVTLKGMVNMLVELFLIRRSVVKIKSANNKSH
ncbi:glycosyltransferase family 2 protein [Patescibacteria group bacterium]|nr:glycosyltransferase family 2 protein [Patescibacteria group bacterium]MDE1946843.1 glycosyltransferase family 2 protein [Patescibacteria group bacterium]MDE2010663.1 glycosyltransferase family 2 protein [Patescibacteria group bacterium]MDE2232731.1 glycosyltransferase family 2 protein [Patescibacteria group bacterium]